MCRYITDHSIARGSQTCSQFGNDLVQTSAAPGGQRSGTFVDVPTAISCPGNATQWNMCYYSSGSATSSTTNFGVYRRSSGTTYTFITESQATYSIAQSASTYACSHFPISQQYVVKPGDIIVVCVQSGGGGAGNRLGIAGTGANTLLNTSPCISLPGATLDTSTYSLSSGITLHVNLGKDSLLCYIYASYDCMVSADVNECTVSNGGCEQLCTDISLGNDCSCYLGYSLDANLKNCSGMSSALIV